MSDAPAYLTASAVADLLAIRQSKVLRWIKTGELHAADVSERPGTGRARWRISRADLDAFLASRQPTQPIKTPRRRARTRRQTGWIDYV